MSDRSRQKAKSNVQNRHNLLRTLSPSLLLFFLVFPPPIFNFSLLIFNSPALAQTTQDRKAEGDRLLREGKQFIDKGQFQAALAMLQ